MVHALDKVLLYLELSRSHLSRRSVGRDSLFRSFPSHSFPKGVVKDERGRAAERLTQFAGTKKGGPTDTYVHNNATKKWSDQLEYVYVNLDWVHFVLTMDAAYDRAQLNRKIP